MSEQGRKQADQQHWHDSADDAAGCVTAVLYEMWDGGPSQRTTENRDHGLARLDFLLAELTRLRAERDEAVARTPKEQP